MSLQKAIIEQQPPRLKISVFVQYKSAKKIADTNCPNI